MYNMRMNKDVPQHRRKCPTIVMMKANMKKGDTTQILSRKTKFHEKSAP